ncbi:MAG TPA: hypothetical protein VLV87_03645 [Gammaproteobacteria bacterium]|nr:hypothetical protein [Gammaproteobacteria bacterium]
MPNLGHHTFHIARLRGLWLALAFAFLTVQMGLPAHEASHPIGQADTACHFCMLGGHAPAMSNVVLPLKLVQFTAEAPRLPVARPVLQTSVRTRYSRGPPLTPVV